MSYGLMAPVTVQQQGSTIPTGASNGPVIDISRWRSGLFRTPAGSAATIMGFDVSSTGTMTALRDATWTAVQQTVVANKWFPLPPSVFNFRFLRLVPDVPPASPNAVFLSGVDGPATWREIAAPIAAGAASTSLIPLEGATAGSFLIPGTWTGATVTFEVGGGLGDLYAVTTLANANVTQATAANRLCSLPPGVFGASFLRITAVAVQPGGNVIQVWLKQEG